MKQRLYFYGILGLIGLVCSSCQWLMFRHALAALQGWGGLVFFMLLPLTFVLPNTVEEYMPVAVSRALAKFGGYWFAFAFYGTMLLVPFFLLWMAVTMSGHGSWWELAAGLYARGALLLLVIILLAGWHKATHPVVREISIATPKVGTDMKIAFASDIHLGMVLGRDFAQKLVQDMNGLEPDLIILGGDIIDGNLRFVLKDGSFQGLAGLKAKHGAYAVLGNHDHYGQDVEREKKELADQGIQCLLGEMVQKEDVQVTGMRDALFYSQDKMPVPKPEKFSLLVDHEPVRLDGAAASGYDLYLAGHTHAGQFWPIRQFTRKMFQLDYGRMESDGMTAVVSSGYGAWGTLFRLQVSPEIVLIQLKKQETDNSKQGR